jgi:tRNA-dihydrouridine synthase B
MMYTEMVNATDLHYIKQLPKIMEVDPNKQPISIQLFDCRPDFFGRSRPNDIARRGGYR